MTLYSTDYLINKFYIELNNKSNSTKKMIIEKQEVVSANKKTFITNFLIICNKLNREVDDIKKYIETELNAKTSISQNGELIIVGVFKQSGIQKIISSYVSQYISCKQCNSCNTEIIKENRINFIFCNKCKAKWSID